MYTKDSRCYTIKDYCVTLCTLCTLWQFLFFKRFGLKTALYNYFVNFIRFVVRPPAVTSNSFLLVPVAGSCSK